MIKFEFEPLSRLRLALTGFQVGLLRLDSSELQEALLVMWALLGSDGLYLRSSWPHLGSSGLMEGLVVSGELNRAQIGSTTLE